MDDSIVQILAYIVMAVGLIGTFAPLLPGAILIWLGVFVWAWADGFGAIGWPTLVALALLVGVSTVVDVGLTAAGAKWGGASWQGMIAASLAAVAGFLIFNFIGALVGGVLGLLAWETRRRGGNWREASRASGGAMLGYVVGAVVRFMLGLAMVLIFVWQAFYAR